MQLTRRFTGLLVGLAAAFGSCSQTPVFAAIEVAPVDRHVYLNQSGGGTQLDDCPNPAHNTKGIAGNTDELSYCITSTPHKFICDAGGGCKSWTITTAACGAPNVANVINGVTVDVDGDGTAENVYGGPEACVYNMALSDSCEVHAGVYTKPGIMATDTTDLSSGGACARSECYTGKIGAFGNGPNMGSAPGTGYGTAAAPGYLRGAVMNGSTDTWDANGDHIPDCSKVTGTSVCYGICSGGTNPDSLCVSGVTTCAGGGTCVALVGQPDSYPATLSGDANGNCNKATGAGCWEATSCDSTSCSGDSFYVGFVGCGYNNTESYNCDASIGGGETRPLLDVNADGVFDFATEQLTPTTSWNVSYFRFKDLAFEYFNGGPTTCGTGGVREYIGAFTFSGGGPVLGRGDGDYAEHVFWHDGFYSRMCADESFTAVFGDNENSWGVVPKRIINSTIFSGNRFVYNDDCGEYGECGGSLWMDGNLIIIQARRSDGTPWATSGPGLSSQGEFQTVFRIKSLDTLNSGAVPKVYRFTRNEVVRQRPAAGGVQAGIFYNECLGHCWRTQGGVYHNATGFGEVWDYGNVYRLQGSASPTWSTFAFPYCSVSGLSGPTGAQQWKLFRFNNTYDIEKPSSTATTTMDVFCNGTGTKYVSRNNAWFGATTVNTDVAATTIYGNASCTGSGAPYACCSGSGSGSCGANFCSTTSGTNTATCTSGGATRTNWFTGAKNADMFSGLSRYVPTTSGTHVLDGAGSCDPDGDGILGVDWDWNPATGASGEETSWVDIAGNVVDCSSGTQDVGAIQNSTAASCLDVCGDGVLCSGVGETCDDGSLAVNACVYGDSPPFAQVCSATCRANVDCSSPAWYGDGVVNGPEVCDGAVPPGTVCPAGCTGGAPTCVPPGAISNAACTGCGAASGTDRHVFLDTDGDLKINQCPNPAHNTYACAPPAIPCNAANLERCNGGANVGKVRGDKTGYISTCSGGSFVTIANGDTADVDADGVAESVYLTPQSCVWNMAKSNSCEVHAGTYKKAGAICDGSCGDQNGVDASGNGAALEGTIGTCDKFDCFQASAVALGDGPNMDGTGYGTSSAPGYLRGASMNGSVDSWDTNGDKQPDGAYAAVLSGDANLNGSFDATTFSGATPSGDSFYGVIEGCGGATYGQYFCRTTPLGSSGYIKIDSDGNGSFDQNVGVFAYNTKEVHHLVIKDLEFTRYNGGNGAYFAGTRPKTSTIDLNGGDGSTDFGLAVDHIYLHDNDFTLGVDNYWDDNVSNEGYTENHWSAFNDQQNFGCTVPTEIANSFLVQNNARLFNFDCGVGGGTTCGCETYVHDNRILVDVDPTKAGVLYRNCVEGGPVPCTAAFTRTHSVVVGYYKHIDGQPQRHRLWNNEVVIKSMGTTRGYFMDLQGFGNAELAGNGALWLYGNLFRDDTAMTLGMSRFWQGFCDIDTGAYDFRMFNNTFDVNAPLGPICSSPSTPGDVVREKNNVFLRTTSLGQSTATVATFENVTSSTNSGDRIVWFVPGTYAPESPGTFNGLANYVPRVGGPLYEKGDNGSTILTPCDPDRDGINGADWYGAGNVTVWYDLAGNKVDCALGTLSYGAIQPNSDGAVPAPTMIKDATLKSATPK